ncbi:MAG: hypothetical protein N3A65_10125, partial [candidate division WOR-3 bacterium]|nr:hypothetical protein [candidate division WOR-3 bacterium]
MKNSWMFKITVIISPLFIFADYLISMDKSSMPSESLKGHEYFTPIDYFEDKVLVLCNDQELALLD